MNYKLIASDYDMTLTNTKREITPRTQTAINNFQKNGGVFALCTSRPLKAVKDMMDNVNINTLILNQGATIYDSTLDKFIYQNLLNKQDVADIISYFDDKSSHIFLLNDAQPVCKKITLAEVICNKIVKYDLKAIGDKFYDYYPKEGVAQIIIFFTSKTKTKKMCNMAKQFFKDKYEIGLCDKHMINLTKKGVTKGQAITEILKYHNLTKDEAVAFGDSQNDESMFTAVKTGVAMGNSMEELKQVADVVCDTCDNDGLAKYIEEYIL